MDVIWISQVSGAQSSTILEMWAASVALLRHFGEIAYFFSSFEPKNKTTAAFAASSRRARIQTLGFSNYTM